MFKNYLLIAFRCLAKTPVYSLINICSLTIGLACCLLIAAFIYYEYSFDTQFKDSDRIYQLNTVITSQKSPEGQEHPQTIYPAVPVLAAKLDDIEQWSRIYNTEVSLLHENQPLRETVQLVDDNFFNLFNFRFLAGNAEDALTMPSSVILTESAAIKYFGQTAAVGETIVIENRFAATVTAVIEDTPDNTHFTVNILLPTRALNSILPPQQSGLLEERWASINSTYGYIKLRPKTDLSSLSRNIRQIMVENSGGKYAEAYTSNLLQVSLKPLLDIHLNTPLPALPKSFSQRHVVYSAAALGVLILLVAIFNYINLSTARSGLRAREIGLRKALGGNNKNLVTQFQFEAFLLTLASTALAAWLFELFMPGFGTLISRDLSSISYSTAGFLVFCGLLMIVTAFLAGTYPAFFLSRLKPSDSLHGANQSGQKRFFRSLVVIAQFTASAVLTFLIFSLYDQLRFLQTMDTGFKTDSIATFTLPETSLQALSQHEHIKAELQSIPGVTTVSFSSAPLPAGKSESNTYGTLDTPLLERPLFGVNHIDADFLPLYQIPILAGRNFSDEITSDRTQVGQSQNQTTLGAAILTELGAKELGWAPSEAIGKEIIHNPEIQQRYAVVGVTENIQNRLGYNDQSLHMMVMTPLAYRAISIELADQNRANTLEDIDRILYEFFPDTVIDRQFVAEQTNLAHRPFQRIASGIAAFALLTITIACLGLYAIASFIVERRVREIGIRKIAGASSNTIIVLLAKSLTWPIVIALAIALPTGHIAANFILSFFSAKTELGFDNYLATTIGTLLLGWGTIATHTWRAAHTNPVSVLRTE